MASKDVNEVIVAVSSKKEEWVKIPYSKKLEYLQQIRVAAEKVSVEWAQLSCSVRKYDTPYLKGVGWLMRFANKIALSI